MFYERCKILFSLSIMCGQLVIYMIESDIGVVIDFC